VISPRRVVVLLSCFLSTLAMFAQAAATNSSSASNDAKPPASSDYVIPGPERSFLRMAGISQKVRPEEVLPLLSRNVFMQGYEGTEKTTEFLILLRRYVVQARELASLASNNGMVIRVSNCEEAKPLLRILGYRTRTECGKPDTSLLTEDPERAFLAIDSGFPLPALERTLQGGKPFEYEYSSSPVPVLFAGSDWTMASKKNYTENSRDLLETILHDPLVARLYWAFSRMDPETVRSLQESIGVPKLTPYAGVLDFYGREIYISNGKVRVPGGTAAEAAWKDLVGASPSSPAAFVSRLIAKDKGWMAAYFDVLSRANEKQQAYFTDPHRLHVFYNALRAPDPGVKATRGTFRPAPSMLVLATRLHLDDAGQPLIPGGLAEWKDILFEGHNGSLLRKWAKQSNKLNDSDDFMKVMFALTRASTETSPLQAYLAISELDSRRPPSRRLSAATVRLLARHYEDYSDQYRIFSEFPELTDESIALFMEVAQRLNTAPMAFRANAFGIFQANVGIWQILVRQGEISNAHINDSWDRVIHPFTGIKSAGQLYDAGSNSLSEIFRFSTGKPRGSQDEIIELLAGPPQSTPEGKQMHQEVARRIRAVLDDQRLVSLDTLITVGTGLTEKATGKHPEEYVALAAAETREFEMPRPIFTESERYQWAAGIYNNHHTDTEMRTDLPKLLKSPTTSRSQIEDARGQLAFFLRDTLVGLNYAYYEPPGAQALHNNPLFVRSHDFAGESVGGIRSLWQAPFILGQGTPAGGGAHFVGSLADLPFALAELEQDFIAPAAVQALIWKEMAPEILASSVLPRWWNVTPAELHAVALYQRSGEELLIASAQDEALRTKVLAILSNRLLPQRVRHIESSLLAGHASDLIGEMMPSDTFFIAAEFQRTNLDYSAAPGSAMHELQELGRLHPDDVNWNRISRDFGTPHPGLAHNDGLELLNVGPMPPFAGRASRYLAESLEAPNLYWARLADEAGYSPVMLHHLVPELTHAMVENIFATDFEDWPALLRAMHEAGAEFKQGKLDPPARPTAPASASNRPAIGQ
jgi:hypothetical protein